MFAQRSGLGFAFAGVALWILVGTLVYFNAENCSVVPRLNPDGTITDVTQCPWTFAQSFYFSIQTGMSIGFGLFAENQDISKLYSCAHILAGSSFIGGALALFAELALVRQMHFMTKEERQIAKASAAIHADGYAGLDIDELREIMVRYPRYARAVILKMEEDPMVAEEKFDQFRGADAVQRRLLANTFLIEAWDKLPEFKNGSMTIHQLAELDRQAAAPMQRFMRMLREKRNFVVIQTCFWTWVIIGILFSMYADKNDFVTALYFSISTLSTAGMVSVKTVANDAHVLFAACFAITGVPLYCLYLGSFAGILVDKYNCRETEQALDAKLSAAEMEFLSHLAKAGNAEDVDFTEFVTFQLLRMGVVDRDLIAAIKEQFGKLDKDGNGTVKLADFVHSADRARSRQMVEVKVSKL